MKFDNLRVAHKLWAVILGLLLLMFAVSVWMQFRTVAVTEETERQVGHYEEAIATAITWRGMVELAVQMSTGSLVTTDTVLQADYDKKVADLTGRITPVQERVNKGAISAQDKQALADIAAARADIRGQGDKLKALKESSDAAARQAFAEKEYRPRATVYLEALDKFVAAQVQQRDAAKQAAEQARSNVHLLGGGIVAVVFVLSILLVLALVRSITQPLQRAVALTEAIASGDLTQQIQDDRADEFGVLMRSLSDMLARLRGLVSEVRLGVNSVSTTSGEIASGNHDLSNRTEQTASSLQKTAGSMVELTGTVNQSAETARQANQLAAAAAQAATRGGDVVGQVVTSMQHITDSSRKISDIIGTIDGIAFQTNILALNAAVEAARAGEQGRGFAVVASEVRSLAQRSAEAAKEIKALIGVSVETVESGSRQVEQAGQTMGEIVGSVQRVADLIGEITASSAEQREGIGQVNQAVSTLDQMTQQNAALVEQSAAAASALSEQAQRLAQVVSAFNVGNEVALAAPVSLRRAPPAPLAAPKPALRLASAKAAPAPKLAAPKPAAKLPPKAAAAPAVKPAAALAAKPAAPKPAAPKPAAPKAIAAPARAPLPAGQEGDWESF